MAAILRLTTGVVYVRSVSGDFSFSDSSGNTAILVGDGADILAQRNGTTAQAFRVYNTFTSATNNERFAIDWKTTANVAHVGNRTATTGTSRNLRLASQDSSAANRYSLLNLDGLSLPYIRLDRATATLGALSFSSAGTVVQIGGAAQSTATSGSVIFASVLPTYNQTSGSAANTDLLLNRTETAIGSGTQLAFETQTGNAPKCRIDRLGTFSVFNAFTSETNNERFSVDWQTQSNVAVLGTRTAATGTTRALQLVAQSTNGSNDYTMIRLDRNTAPLVRIGLSALAGAFNGSSAVTGNLIQLASVTSTAISGAIVGTAVTPVYNQASGTAANTDFLIQRTETAIGSGAQLLFDAQVGSTSKFSVSRTGLAQATAGTGTARISLNGVLLQTVTSFTPAGTGEEIAWEFTVPADTLATNGSVIEFVAPVSFAANANTKRIRVYWGATAATPGTGTLILDNSSTSSGVTHTVRGTVMRIDATNAISAVHRSGGQATATALGSQSFTAGIIVHITLTNVTSAADSSLRFGQAYLHSAV
jgi:hypothetical protein